MVFVPRTLVGKRVLVVEDELAVALMIEDFLVEFGCTHVGPYGTLTDALEAVRAETFDLAVLDINLHGELSFPVAHVLAEKRVPFLFVSGYGEEMKPAGFGEWTICAKPFKGDNLAAMLLATLGHAKPIGVLGH